MNYPLISEYIEAIKAAEDNFEQLSYLRPVLDDDGLPVMTSGNFAVVFKMKDERDEKYFAVKCFTKEQEGREDAYHLITEEMKNVSSPYLTPVRYLDKELFVDTDQTNETEFPVLLMDWVEGKTLDKYLRENLDDKFALEMLAYRFSQLAQWLIPQPFAHGDLKPDNILVRDDGTLVLVDYDGMYVPAMKGQKARELGSPDFRHPQRTENDFDEHIDDFPLVSILLSLKAISYDPQFLYDYGGSDRLLLSKNDYKNINNCLFFKNVMPSGQRVIDRLFSLFCISYYDHYISRLHYSLLKIYSPIPLIPYKIRRNRYTFYDNINKKLLSSFFNFVDFLDPKLECTTSCIISNEISLQNKNNYKNAAIISNLKDLSNIIWYKNLFFIGNTRNLFIAENYQGFFGILDDKGTTMLGFHFQSITPLVVGDKFYLKCKKAGFYGLLNHKLNIIIPFVLREMWDYSRLYLIVYKGYNEDNYALNLESLKECKLPVAYNYIEDFQEGVLALKFEHAKYRFYNFEKQEFINQYTYQEIGKMKDSYVLCKRNNKNILLSTNGTEYCIDHDGRLSHYGNIVIGVKTIEIEVPNPINLVKIKHYRYIVYVFNKNVLERHFVYKKDNNMAFAYDKVDYFDLINRTTIWVWHRTLWGVRGIYINLKGEHVDNPSPQNDMDTQPQNKWLIETVKEKYINSDNIKDFDEMNKEYWNYFRFENLGNIVHVNYHWENGSCDAEDFYYDDIAIGYADDKMCYWAKDCMTSFI